MRVMVAGVVAAGSILLGSLLLPGTSAAGDLPGLDLSLVSDPVLRQALAADSNLPVLEAQDGIADAPVAAAEADSILADADRKKKILTAFGYLDGEIDASRNLVKVIPGDVYTLGLITVDGVFGKGLDRAFEQDLRFVLQKYAGRPARADVLSNLERDLSRRVSSQGHPQMWMKRRVLEKTALPLLASVRLSVDLGPELYFGNVVLAGLHRTPPETLRPLMTFKTGEPFDREKLRAFRESLKDTEKFLSVRVNESPPDQQGRVAVNIRLRERTIAAGALWDSGRKALFLSLCSLFIVGVSQVGVSSSKSRPMRWSFYFTAAAALAVIAYLAEVRLGDLLGGFFQG